MAPLVIDLLGGFAAYGRGRLLRLQRRKSEALLSYLAMRPGYRFSRESLTALLWPNVPDDQARHSLRQVLLELRSAFPQSARAVLVVEGYQLSLDPAGIAVDVAAFERLAAQDTRAALERAAAMYRGDLLQGHSVNELPFEEWLRTERERLRETAVRVLQTLLSLLTQDRALDRAVDTALRILALDPLQESTHRALMQLYDRTGRRAAALRQYERCVEIFRRELGVAPELETRRLHKALLAKSNDLPAVSTPRSPRSSEPVLPLVGRHVELTRIHASVADVGLGRGHVILFTGEAGVGKTRLLAEVDAHAGSAGFRSLFGRCYALTRVLAFGPWIEALRTTDIPSDVESIGQLRPSQRANLARLLPEIADANNPPVERSEDPTNLFEAIVHLLQHLASRQPLLVMIEDLHWADEMSIRLLFYLGRRLAASPVLLVATLRPDEDAAALRALADFEREWPQARVTVPPLSRVDTGALTQVLVSASTPRDVLAQIERHIWEMSQGNPFMIVEALRSRAVNDSEALTAPSAGIIQLVERRIDQLGYHARVLAATLAVAGRDIEFDVLWRASDLDERAAADALELLIRHRLLHAVGEAFDFVHDIVREAAGCRLIGAQRRALHHALANAIEALRAGTLDAHVSTLARHFLEAEVWDKAHLYLARAATQAIDRSAWRDALALIERATDALERVPQTPETCLAYIDLVLERYAAFVPLGLSTKAPITDLVRAHEMATATEDLVRVSRTSARLAQCTYVKGHNTEAKDHANRAIVVGAKTGDVAGPALARLILTEIHFFEGDDAGTITTAKQNIAAMSGGRGLARHFGQSSLAAVVARQWLAWSLARQGHFDEGLTYGAQAREIADSGDSPYALGSAYYATAGVHLARGNVTEAIPLLELGRELSRSRIQLFRSGFASMLGLAYARAGRATESIPLLEEGADVATLFALRMQPFRLVSLAIGYVGVGRVDDAHRAVDRALELALRYQSTYATNWALNTRALAALTQEPPDAALAIESSSRALAGALAAGTRPLAAHCHLVLSRGYRQTGDFARCDEHLALAVGLFEAMCMPHWVLPSDQPSTVAHA